MAGWVAGTGCDAWIVQREVSDPVEYVNLWLRDASEAFDPARAEAWLDWFDAVKVEGVGYGVVTLRRSGRDVPVVRVEELRQVPVAVARRPGARLVRPPGLARRARRAGHRRSPGRPGCG